MPVHLPLCKCSPNVRVERSSSYRPANKRPRLPSIEFSAMKDDESLAVPLSQTVFSPPVTDIRDANHPGRLIKTHLSDLNNTLTVLRNPRCLSNDGLCGHFDVKGWTKRAPTLNSARFPDKYKVHWVQRLRMSSLPHLSSVAPGRLAIRTVIDRNDADEKVWVELLDHTSFAFGKGDTDSLPLLYFLLASNLSIPSDRLWANSNASVLYSMPSIAPAQSCINACDAPDRQARLNLNRSVVESTKNHMRSVKSELTKTQLI